MKKKPRKNQRRCGACNGVWQGGPTREQIRRKQNQQTVLCPNCWALYGWRSVFDRGDRQSEVPRELAVRYGLDPDGRAGGVRLEVRRQPSPV